MYSPPSPLPSLPSPLTITGKRQGTADDDRHGLGQVTLTMAFDARHEVLRLDEARRALSPYDYMCDSWVVGSDMSDLVEQASSEVTYAMVLLNGVDSGRRTLDESADEIVDSLRTSMRAICDATEYVDVAVMTAREHGESPDECAMREGFARAVNVIEGVIVDIENR